MANKRQTKKRINPNIQQAAQKDDGLNMPLMAGIIGLFALGLIGLLIYTFVGGDSNEGQTIGERNAAYEATATAQFEALPQGTEVLDSLENYCDASPNLCLVSGDPDSDIVVHEVSDYGCGSCATFNQGVIPQFKSEFVETDEVKFVKIISAPLYPNMWDSRQSAEAVLCANDQGRGNEYHEQIFGIQVAGGNPPMKALVDLAENLGLDSNSFESCVKSGDYRLDVEKSTLLVQQNGVTGTPTVFVNGEKATATASGIAQAIETMSNR